ncbi:Zonular occludens toxin (Zot) [compost metagenome]
MIEAWIGLPGAGKTYMVTRKATKLIKKGHRVYANYPLKGAIRYTQVSELFEIKREPGEKKSPLLIIDEAGLIAPAGGWKAIPFEVMAHWRQHRHAGVNIWYTAQDLRDVAVPLRRVTQLVNAVSKFGPIIKWRTYNPINKGKYGSGFTIFDKSVAQQYDSYADNVERQDYLKGQ